MPATVTSITAPTGCGHQQITVDLDGESIVVPIHSNDTLIMTDHKEMLVKCAIQRKLAAGNTIASLNGKGIF